MSTPRLFVATRTGGKLLRYDVGPTDNGKPFTVFFQTGPYAPGGIGGEAMFDRMHIAVTRAFEAPATLRVTPILSTYDPVERERKIVERDPIDILLEPSPGVRTQVTHTIGLGEAYIRDGVERFRVALRGEWIAFRVETTGPLPAGDLCLDRLAFEATVVTSTAAAVNAQ